ncbi:AI-2E family transporter [Horticoccus luteus]|uniref:AI-2E family transporter n=1 Tax=Horticoccus luteus TaxID=2862869 RepID=A0A8F9TW21_9BACT|nr:AI-2E family transporter [Horticoccus luteus]QYM78813.1 AI-2E family transporter [Horticoccus luteus]
MTKTQTATRFILIGLALVALGLLLWKTSEVAIVAFGGVVGAAAWRGIAVPVARWTKLSEKKSVVLVVVVFLVVFIGAAWAFGAQASEQFAQLQQTIPRSIQEIKTHLQASDTGRSVVRSVHQAMNSGDAVSRVGLAAGALLAGAADMLLMLFVSIYLAIDPGEYLRGFLRLLPPGRRPQVKSALEEAGADLQKWLLAQLVAMAVVGVAVGTGLAILGVPLALLLGLIAAVLEFVPVVGPILFAIPGVLVAFTQSPKMVLSVVILYVVVQTLESNVLIPLLQRWAVRLPPVISLVATLAAAILFGPIGMIFASPLAVVVLALVKNLYVEDTLESPGVAA